jgi:hypothetical protein
MNAIRILLNGVITFFGVWAGAYLLARDSYFLHGRYNTEFGSLFSGTSLYLLAISLFFFAAFAAAVALAWLNGSLAMPNPHKLSTDFSFKGQLIIRYWYFVAPGFLLLMAAMTLAERMPTAVYKATL